MASHVYLNLQSLRRRTPINLSTILGSGEITSAVSAVRGSNPTTVSSQVGFPRAWAQNGLGARKPNYVNS